MKTVVSKLIDAFLFQQGAKEKTGAIKSCLYHNM